MRYEIQNATIKSEGLTKPLFHGGTISVSQRTPLRTTISDLHIFFVHYCLGIGTFPATVTFSFSPYSMPSVVSEKVCTLPASLSESPVTPASGQSQIALKFCDAGDSRFN